MRRRSITSASRSWCDEYFFLPHRNETRGVGGIFFDYLEGDIEKLFAFVHDCGDAFLEAYLPIAAPPYARNRTRKRKGPSRSIAAAGTSSSI